MTVYERREAAFSVSSADCHIRSQLPPHGLATQLVNDGIHEHDAAQDVFFAQEPIDIESACEQRQAGLQP